MEQAEPINLNRSVLRLTGADCRDFLQGILTNDIARLDSPGDAQFTALLTPQGKVLFDFFLLHDETGSFLADVASDMAEALLQRLTFYKLRADVTLEKCANLSVRASADGLEDVRCFRDPRTHDLGFRHIFEAETDVMSEPQEYTALRIAHAIPAGGIDYEYGQVFAHDAMLDLLGAVDRDKGCYVGQEVVSRMHHRGTARRRIIPFESQQTIAIGTAVTAGSSSLGTVTTALGNRGMATIRLDRLAEAREANNEPVADGIPVTFSSPPWAIELNVA